MNCLKSFAERAKQTSASMGLAVLLFLTALVANLEPPRGDSLWFHLRMGREVLATGSIPHHSSFLASQSTFDPPYYLNDSFGFDALLSLVEQAAGLPGLALLKSLLLALTAVLAFAGCLLAGSSAGLSALLVIMDMWVTRSLYPLHPLLLTDLFLAAQTFLLLAQEKSRRCFLPWALLPLYALWANFEGGFLVGLICLGVWWLGESVARGQGGIPPGQLGYSLLAAGLVACLNPEGWRIYPHVFHALLHPEGAPLSLQDLEGPAGILLVTIAVAFIGAARACKLRWPHLLVSLTLVYLAVRHAPSIGQLGVGATPLTAAAFALWLSEPPRLRRGEAFLSTAILVVVLLAGPLDSRWTDPSPNSALYPERAIRFLRVHQPEGMVVFNSIDQGSYLIYRDIPTLIHNNPATYAPALAQDYQAMLQDPQPEQLTKYKVGAFLLRHTEQEDALAQKLQATKDWSSAYSDELSTVLIRAR